LLVARIHDAVDHDCDEQDHALDNVLPGILDVHDGHAVHERADQQRAYDNIPHAALTPGQADAAEHDDQNDVIEQGRVDDAGVHQSDPGRHGQPGDIAHKR